MAQQLQQQTVKPGSVKSTALKAWIPAFAGMTALVLKSSGLPLNPAGFTSFTALHAKQPSPSPERAAM